MSGTSHEDLICDQFTRQAVPFSTAAPISDERALAMVVAAGQPGRTTTCWILPAAGVLSSVPLRRTSGMRPAST